MGVLDSVTGPADLRRMSEEELTRKIFAIFKHESQKDKALFPGPVDTREFWQRAEDRNRHTAELYDELGLPEYQAIEGFVMWQPSDQDGSMGEVAGAEVSATVRKRAKV